MPTVDSIPQGITPGWDGALWFTESNGNKIGRITVAGTITEYPVPTANGYPFMITAGRDGALWFTESFANKIGRITTPGTITEYSVPTANGYPVGIAAGPDGALWFTEQLANKIGRITPAGAITEYPISVNPGMITAGPDGALWFTEPIVNKIGRITTAGAILEYPVPTANSSPGEITAGPDGALWFTEYGGHKIGRITTAGAITEYPTPTASSYPQEITAGPDGALWFTEGTVNQIGRITTAGAIIEYPVPTANSYPGGITAGPDGALWFTEAFGDKIGRAILASSPSRANRAQQTAPIKLGTSGSNLNDASCCSTGTLGSLVQKTSGGTTTTYVLSSNRLLARSNAASIGEQIIQRGYADTVPACSGSGAMAVAELSQFVTLDFSGGFNRVDAAMAATLPGQVDPTGAILGIGTVSSATVGPSLRMLVMKAGRTSGKTYGSIDAVNVTAKVGPYGPCGSATQYATFVKQFMIIPGTAFSRSGDSGSLIVKRVATGAPNPVGLLFAASPNYNLANPINAVLSLLGVTVVGNAPAAAELANAAPGPIDAAVQAASRVKDRYDDFLLSLPEAVGHGVGYSPSGSGKIVIRLFLRRATDATRLATPGSLDGIPIEIEETGEFRPIAYCGSSVASAER